eukprot:TCONS_00022349-protein
MTGPEVIINHRKKKGKMEYLVKWRNKPMTQNTWVPKNKLDSSFVQPYTDKTRYSVNNINLTTPRRHMQNVRGTAIIWLMLLNWVTKSEAMQLGPIYDCTRVKPTGIYRFPDIRNCTVPPDDETRRVQTFKAEVLHESPKYTLATLFHCSKFEATLTCKEGFLGGKRK